MIVLTILTWPAGPYLYRMLKYYGWDKAECVIPLCHVHLYRLQCNVKIYP